MTQPAEKDSLSPMEYVEANGFIDFPHAWQIARRTAPEYHHNRCSFNTTGGAILCDCEVLTKSPEYVLAYGIPPAAPSPDREVCPECGLSAAMHTTSGRSGYNRWCDPSALSDASPDREGSDQP